MNRLAGDLGLSQDTVARHVRYLRNAYLLWHCPQRNPNTWTARERAQDKLYAVDPVIARLAHLRNEARSDIDVTVLTEMQIGMAVHRAAHADGLPWAGDCFLFHLRTPTRKEVDFVAEPLAGVAIEGKYVEGGRWHGEAATVTSSGFAGILVTRNVLDVTDVGGVWALPAGVLCYLLDT
jgi:hypothetical protein